MSDRNKLDPEKEAIFARAKLKIEGLRAIAEEWTEKYRQIRRERYGDHASDEDDEAQKQAPAATITGRDKAYPKVSVAGGGVRLAGVIGGVNNTLTKGAANSSLGDLARTWKMDKFSQKSKDGSKPGRSENNTPIKAEAKRGREEEDDSEEEVGRTGAFKSRKSAHRAGQPSSNNRSALNTRESNSSTGPLSNNSKQARELENDRQDLSNEPEERLGNDEIDATTIKDGGAEQIINDPLAAARLAKQRQKKRAKRQRKKAKQALATA